MRKLKRAQKLHNMVDQEFYDPRMNRKVTVDDFLKTDNSRKKKPRECSQV